MRDFLSPSRFGRDDEIARLAAAVTEAAGAHGSAAFLVGEAGIGKSRLIRETIHAARRTGMPVLVGRATPSGSTVAFRPVAEALFSYFRDQDLPDDPELEPFRSSLARLVPQWRQGGAGHDDSIVLLAEAILRLLRLVGRGRGCVLALEDLHWADPETLSIVEYLSENLATEPVLLLGSVRSAEPGQAADLVDALAARRAAAVTHLRRLDAADTAAMARSCLGVTDLPPPLHWFLEVSADGLPFFVEELLAGAVDAGALVDSGDGWVVPGPLEARVPRTFVDSVQRRLDSLGESAHILRTAAVLGRRFEWALLCDVAGEAPEAVLGVLRAGVELQLLVAGGPAAGTFSFRHALTRDAIVDGVLAIERAEIARRALEAIVAAHPGLPGEWCDLAAALAETAGDPRAAELLVESGRRALAHGGLASAEETFAHARQLAADPAVKADALEALSETLAAAGKVDAALDLGQEVVTALHVVAAPPQRLVDVHARLAAAASFATHWDAADRHLQLARRHVAKSADEGLLARVDVTAAQIAYGRGDLDRALEGARQVRESAEQLGLHELECEALLVIGHCARVSDVERAEEVYREVVGIAEQQGLELLRIRALFELGTIDYMTLRPPDHLHAARALAAETGALATVAQIDLHLGVVATLRFDPAEALAASRRAGDAARRLRMPAVRARALVVEATAHGRLGRRDEMAALVAEAVTLGGEDRSVAALVGGHCRAEFSLRDEDRRQALVELDGVMDLLRGFPTGAALPHRGLWALVRAVEDVDAEAACAEVRASGATAQHLNLGHVLYAEAVVAGRAGRSDEADLAFVSADRVLADLGWYRHLARRLVAEAAIADGWGQPAEWLRGALLHFEQQGQERLMTACRSLLKRAGAPVPRRRTDDSVPAALRERGITEREGEVLGLLADGLGNNEIASRLFLSPRTVERHIANLTGKTDLRTRSELVAFAARIAAGSTTT